MGLKLKNYPPASSTSANTPQPSSSSAPILEYLMTAQILSCLTMPPPPPPPQPASMPSLSPLPPTLEEVGAPSASEEAGAPAASSKNPSGRVLIASPALSLLSDSGSESAVFEEAPRSRITPYSRTKKILSYTKSQCPSPISPMPPTPTKPPRKSIFSPELPSIDLTRSPTPPKIVCSLPFDLLKPSPPTPIPSSQPKPDKLQNTPVKRPTQKRKRVKLPAGKGNKCDYVWMSKDFGILCCQKFAVLDKDRCQTHLNKNINLPRVRPYSLNNIRSKTSQPRHPHSPQPLDIRRLKMDEKYYFIAQTYGAFDAKVEIIVKGDGSLHTMKVPVRMVQRQFFIHKKGYLIRREGCQSVWEMD